MSSTISIETTERLAAADAPESPSGKLLQLAGAPDANGPADAPRTLSAADELEDAARGLAIEALRAGHLLELAARDLGQSDNPALAADAWVGVLGDLARDLTRAAVGFRDASDFGEACLMFRLPIEPIDD